MATLLLEGLQASVGIRVGSALRLYPLQLQASLTVQLYHHLETVTIPGAEDVSCSWQTLQAANSGAPCVGKLP